MIPSIVITGLVPVIPMGKPQRPQDRHGRDKPGHDEEGVIPGEHNEGRGSPAG
jgi:hypothetical protein